MVTAAPPELSLGEWATLALLREQPTHGWAIVKLLAPVGDVGSVWSLSRPLVYRAVERLEAARLIEPIGVQQLGNRSRTLFTATAIGRRAADRWLAAPVDHVRDVRTELCSSSSCDNDAASISRHSSARSNAGSVSC